MKKNKLFTIGFTKKSAEEFFSILSSAGIRRIVDVRLNNNSQLAGFAKQKDLRYFLKAIGNIDYIHVPEFSPLKEIFDQYKKDKIWENYRDNFNNVLSERYKNDIISKIIMNDIKASDCLLCAEEKADKCHRRLLAEFIQSKRGDFEIVHL